MAATAPPAPAAARYSVALTYADENAAIPAASAASKPGSPLVHRDHRRMALRRNQRTTPHHRPLTGTKINGR